jgi:hypothetical protein
MFLFTYPHIRKEKDGIGKEKHEGVKPLNGIPSFSFLICGYVKRNMRGLNRSMISHPSPS